MQWKCQIDVTKFSLALDIDQGCPFLIVSDELVNVPIIHAMSTNATAISRA